MNLPQAFAIEIGGADLILVGKGTATKFLASIERNKSTQYRNLKRLYLGSRSRTELYADDIRILSFCITEQRFPSLISITITRLEESEGLLTSSLTYLIDALANDACPQLQDLVSVNSISFLLCSHAFSAHRQFCPAGWVSTE